MSKQGEGDKGTKPDERDVERGVLVVADVEELTKNLRRLHDKELEELRAKLCPGATFIRREPPTLADILHYWIENEPNPTREKLLEQMQAIELSEQPTVKETKSSALSTASGWVSKFVSALSGGPATFLKDKKGAKALVEACAGGDREAVADLLRKGINPNVIAEDKTPLHEASLMGDLDIVKDLMKAGADVQFTCKGKAARPALNAASSFGHDDVVEFLLDHGASVNAVDGEKQTALHEAAIQSHPSVVRLLLEHGAIVNKKSDDGSTPLIAASPGGDVETIKLLLDYGANASIRLPKWDRAAIHQAAARGHPKAVDLLLSTTDAPINDQDHDGMTPLMFAVFGHVRRDGSPAMYERLAQLLETVRLLVEKGADLNIQTKTGKTALMLAAMKNRLDEARVLVDAGADLDIQDQEKGWSAIFFAADNKDLPIAQLLCESGASITLLDKRKRSIFDLTKIHSPSVYKMLSDVKNLGLEAIKKQKQATQGDRKDSGENQREDIAPRTPLPEIPSYYKYDEKYPGIRFFGTPWMHLVTSDGAHISDWGKEIGIEFEIPPGAVPEGKQLELSVWPCADGPFQFPEGYEAASPAYLITPSFEFSCNVTLKMYHFFVTDTVEDCEDMTFLSSSSSHYTGEKQQPQYQFRVLDNSVFKPTEEYGCVSLKHFCLSIVGVKRKRSSQSKTSSTKRRKVPAYAYQVYQEQQYQSKALFSAALNQPYYFQVLEEHVQKYFPKEELYTTSTEPITIQGDKLALHWPLDTGWEITPNKKPEISIDMLNNHKAHHYPPKIELDVEKVSSSSRQSTYIEIDVVGISGEKNFILKPKPRPAMPQGMPFVPEHGNSGLVYGTMPPWGQMVPPAYHSPRYDPQYMSQGYVSQSLESSSSSSSFSPPPHSPMPYYPTGACGIGPVASHTHTQYLPQLTSLSLRDRPTATTAAPTLTSVTTSQLTGKLDINRDVLTVKTLLKNLNKNQLRDLFRTLGLFDDTVQDKYPLHSTSEYADDLIRTWILGRDKALEATWENLKYALTECNHIGIAKNI